MNWVLSHLSNIYYILFFMPIMCASRLRLRKSLRLAPLITLAGRLTFSSTFTFFREWSCLSLSSDETPVLLSMSDPCYSMDIHPDASDTCIQPYKTLASIRGVFADQFVEWIFILTHQRIAYSIIRLLQSFLESSLISLL